MVVAGDMGTGNPVALARIDEKDRPQIYNQSMHPLARLQKLLLRLSDNWHCYRLFLEQGDVPATNNATERSIGRWRIRSHSVRGFKTWSGLVSVFTLRNSLIV